MAYGVAQGVPVFFLANVKLANTLPDCSKLLLNMYLVIPGSNLPAVYYGVVFDHE